MLKDRYGLPLSTASPAARDAYLAGVDCILSATAGVERHLGRAIEADPEFALAHAALARGLFAVQHVPEARTAAAKARELVSRASPREQAHVNALALAIEGKPVESFAATREHLAQYPRDAMVLAPATGVFGLIGFSGRQEREPELYAFLRAYAPAYGDDWWFESMLAFAACESGRLEEARVLMERSMAAHPGNAHGAHIKVHVLYESGEPQAGFDYLEGWMPGFEREGLLHCHLSWHVAIFALELGARAAAGSVVPLLAEGLAAYGAGQWDRAAELLGKALPETVRIGGSRAQRDLVVKTLGAAYLKAGREPEARALLAQRAA